MFNSDPVKAEVGAIANVIKQYSRALESGAVDDDKILPEYVEALKAGGGDVLPIHPLASNYSRCLASIKLRSA